MSGGGDVAIESLLDLLGTRMMSGLGEAHLDSVLKNYLWKPKRKFPETALAAEAAAEQLGVPVESVQNGFVDLAHRGLVLRIASNGSHGYLLSPLGCWVAQNPPSRLGDAASALSVLTVLDKVLQERWSTEGPGDEANDVVIPPAHAVFVLFMLIGGAVGAGNVLRWRRHEIQSMELARDLLRWVSTNVNAGVSPKQWEVSKLSDYIRRTKDWQDVHCPELRKRAGDGEGEEETLLNLVASPTAEELTPILSRLERSLGSTELIRLLEDLEREPWSKGDFAARVTGIDSLFGRGTPRPAYRRTLVEAARRAAHGENAE